MTSVWLRTAPSGGRDQISSVAIELADRHGLEAVSLRRVASRLGSARTSLYHHVANRNELYELMADAVIGEIELLDCPSGDWRADLRSLACATRGTFARHRWFVHLRINPIPGPWALRYSAVAIRSLEGLGLDAATEVSVLATLNRYVVGYMQREAARQARRAHRHTNVHANASTDEAESGEQRAADENFVFGLDCVLDRISAGILTQRRAGAIRPSGDMVHSAGPHD